MKIYDHFEAVPSRVYGLVELLLSAGRGGMNEHTVTGLMQPPTLRSDDSESPIVRRTIDAAVEAGLLQRRPTDTGDQDVISICDDIYKELHGRSLDEHLPLVMSRLLLRPEIGGHENRFATLCAWLLAQPASWMPRSHGEVQSRLSDQGLDLARYGVTNSSSLDNVLYWAKYLGLIWQAKNEGAKGIIPDPTVYLRRHLDEVLPPGEPVAAYEFRRRVGQVCPVLDGGPVRLAVMETLCRRGAKNWPADQMSDALSLAIRGLSDMKLIRYGCRDDVRVFLVLSRAERIASLERVQ